MFKKLLIKVDEFIDNFNKITNLEEIAIEVLNIITEVFNKKNIDEKFFDEIMQIPGLWKSIGEKLKKSLKSKEELLKQLLYICTIMNEFERRYKAKQKNQRKDKEVKKIIEKYSRYIKEISESTALSKEVKNVEIKKMRVAMEREINELDLQLER